MTPLDAARAASSARVLAALSAPLAAVAGLAATGRVAWADVAEARVVLLWLALLAAALLARAFADGSGRRWPSAVAALAAASLVAQAGVSAAFGFDVRLEAGEGEERPPIVPAWAGRLARPPSVVVLALPAERGGEATLAVDGREQALRVGQETRVEGTGIAVEDVFAAPTFVARRTKEHADEDAVQVKLRPAERSYFVVGVLPHRFYVTLPPPLPDQLGPTPPKINLLVQRGKLKILERDFARAEPARFEGIELGYGDGARWAVVRVRSAPRPWLAGIGVGLAIAAAVLAVRRRGA